MDEGTLNDLLECSVCLERLDTSSKVLPCQHTFCRKCLEEIVEKHKELRCPECRILIHVKIDELPPNVLLMRILEGMRNAAPKKQTRNSRENYLQQPIMQQNTPIHHISQGTPDHRHKSNKPAQQHYLSPHQPYAKALYDYASKEPGDLNFKRGDTIILRKRVDCNWYRGECSGREGVFPLSYVQIITPVPSHVPQCKALYDFRMMNDEEEGCLAFNKGDIINVIRRVDENWAEGKLDGRIGIFPLAFVELNGLARSLMKLSTNSQPGPSKVAPPTPTTEESSLLIMSDHARTNSGNVQMSHAPNPHVQNHVMQHQHQQQQAQQQQQQQQNAATIPASDSSSTVSSGSSSTTTPNTTSSNNSSSPSTAPSSPASPPPRNQQPVPPRNHKSEGFGTPQRQPPTANNAPPPRPEPHPQQIREKRHSFTSLTPQHHSSNTHRHSAEILAPEINVQTGNAAYNGDRHRRSSELTPMEPATYVALYPYKPQKPDELELKKGGIYMVTERCQDGWFKGTSNRTQKCGVFPGNYVTLARGAPRSPQSSSSRGGGDDSKNSVSFTRSGKSRQMSNLPPELPPRSASPACGTNTISSSWHGQQDSAAVALGRSSSAIMSSVTAQSVSSANNVGKLVDKSKERKEKSTTVSLMRRLTSIKRSKSPPPASYSMDNPVFEDTSVSGVTTTTTTIAHPVHVRSGSCPSQLLQQVQPSSTEHRVYASTSQRVKHKERPSVLPQTARTGDNPTGSSGSSPDIHHHRKSNSLDAGSKNKTGTQTVRERFRCIAPYPPNSEYELELQVNDVIYVHKKREDGWYKGTQQRTGRTGLFPASFVENF